MDHVPAGPCVIVRDWLADHGLYHRTLALRTGLSAKHVSQVLTGHVPLTAHVAVLIEQATGLDADHLMIMQARRDVAVERAHAAELAAHTRQHRTGAPRPRGRA